MIRASLSAVVDLPAAVVGPLLVALCLLPNAGCALPAASAQCTPLTCPPQASTHSAVVRVSVSAPGGVRCYGSGTLIDKNDERGIVLSCAHLFRSGADAVTVTFSGGQRYTADVLEIDNSWDLSALRIPSPDATPVRVAADHAKPGEPLESCGYGSDGRYWCNRGRAIGYARTSDTASYETLQISGTARDGDSGGPILNARGELVAVLWGTDGRRVGGTYCGRIRKFLAGIASLGKAPPATWQHSPDAVESAPPASVPAGQPNQLEGIRQRLDGLAGGLGDINRRWDDRQQSLQQRLEKIEDAVNLVSNLRTRLETTETALGEDNLRAKLKDLAVSAAGTQTPRWTEVILPGLLAAIGWTGPPSAAAIIAIRLAAAMIRRRRSKQESTPVAETGLLPRPTLNDDYAGQLAQVYALSGRSPMADVTLGREYDRELGRAEQSSDGARAAWARELRRNVAKQFYRIHDQSPLPAEPISAGQTMANPN